MKRTLIACAMLEQEIKYICEKRDLRMEVLWLDRGYHNTPEKLKEKLQEMIDGLQEEEEILLAFGLCGNGTAGLVSPRATLVIPKFDDCINMLLCTGTRRSRGLTEAGNIYLTKGWTMDEEAILTKYEAYIEEYGQEDAEAILEMMYENYKSITVIDTGLEDLKETLEYAKKTAELLDLSTKVTEGSVRILEQLLTGEWDENFILQKPGKPLETSQWEVSNGK